MCKFLGKMSTINRIDRKCLCIEIWKILSVKWEFVDIYTYISNYQLKIENKFENIIRIYSNSSPSKWSSISLWRNFGDRGGWRAEEKKKKKRNTFEISTSVSSPDTGATRVQHLFSGYDLRIFVTTIESAGNATAHPACSQNLFYSYSITLGYAFAQWK